jgi:hypothetical protein
MNRQDAKDTKRERIPHSLGVLGVSVVQDKKHRGNVLPSPRLAGNTASRDTLILAGGGLSFTSQTSLQA